MGYQFIHVNSYSKSGSKKSKETKCVKSTMAEAMRMPGYFKHVDNPETPLWLYGADIAEVETMAEQWGERNKIRKDGHILLAGVISVPADFAAWDEYKSDCISWLKDKYGDCLKSVVEHTDEDRPHIHFYVIPREGAKFDSLHEGEKARNEARANKLKTTEQNDIYKKAMQKLQADFNLLSSRYGLAKDGPKRRRMTRKEWKAEKAAGLIMQQAHTEKSEIIIKVKNDAKNYIEQKEKEIIQKKVTAEKNGFEAGLKKFAEQPIIKQIKQVYLYANNLIFNKRNLTKQKINNTVSAANNIQSKMQKSINNLKSTAADLQAALNTEQAQKKQAFAAYEKLLKEKRDLEILLKKPKQLNFADTKNNKNAVVFK